MANSPTGPARGSSHDGDDLRQPKASSRGSERGKEGRVPSRDFSQSRGRSDRYGGEGRPPRERTEGSRDFRKSREPSRESSPRGDKGRSVRIPKTWGALSRRGAVKAVDFREDRNVGDFSRSRTTQPPAPFVPEGFLQVDEAEPTAKAAGSNSRKAPARVRAVNEVIDKEITRTMTAAKRTKLQRLFASAVESYEKDRYQEAKRMLEEVLTVAPDSLSTQELYGLALYRLGQWSACVKVLESFSDKSGSFDQYPVIADSYRALKRYKDVDRIWTELAAASPSAEVMGEGRIVIAGAAADQGNLSKAISILERSLAVRRKPRFVDLRQWYVLADLYERAGEISHARSLFSRIIEHDADFFDVAERLSDLG